MKELANDWKFSVEKKFDKEQKKKAHTYQIKQDNRKLRSAWMFKIPRNGRENCCRKDDGVKNIQPDVLSCSMKESHVIQNSNNSKHTQSDMKAPKNSENDIQSLFKWQCKFLLNG